MALMTHTNIAGTAGTADDPFPTGAEYPLLPLKNVVVFPRTVVNLTIGRHRSIQALNLAMSGDRRLILHAQRDTDSDDPDPEHLYDVGTLVEVRQVRRQADATVHIEVEALRRVRIEAVVREEPCYTATVEFIRERAATGREAETLMQHLVDLFDTYSALNSRVPPDASEHIRAARLPGYMADLLAAHLISDVHERQKALAMDDQWERLQHMSSVLVNAIDILETEGRVLEKVRASLDKNQREFYLREQLKAIHDELGSEDGNESAELRRKLAEKGMPPDTLTRMLKEVNKLERIPSVSPEGTVLRNYLDWALSLPWDVRSEDRIDLPLAEQILEEDHYGLSHVKELILDYLAVRQLTLKRRGRADELGMRNYELGIGLPLIPNSPSGAILCFVGPPGVGKTSLGQSIARAMNRKFVRLSLGGVHDEAEVRGHRRTYVGAMPGRIIQAMKGAGTTNPVMLLDEVDKMASDMRGDPAAAMLEALDSAQNHTFVDHYLDVPYDLSDVLFIATANTLHSISKPLRDRMEVVEIGGYTEEEKVQIARRHLLPRQVEVHGLDAGFLEAPDAVLRTIIRTYTREAGVRELDRKLATICRKAARRVVAGRITRVRVNAHNLEELLGSPRYRAEADTRQDAVGVSMGLAWTEHGGEMLPVEVVAMPGHGALTITGRLGDVMQESARAALTFARSRAAHLHIDLEALEKTDLHIHLPEGAIPKDGPSAGITMAAALISAITRRPVRANIAMTGEITLTGRVLAIGGLKDKALAAHRAGMKFVIAPLANKSDWQDLPRPVRAGLGFIWVETMDQVVAAALREVEPAIAVPTVPMTPEALRTLPEVGQEEEGKVNRRKRQDTLPTTAPSVQTAKPRRSKQAKNNA